MADIELVIKIPEEVKQSIAEFGTIHSYFFDSLVSNAIGNGTPLPKGHGRLIDADSKIEVDTAETTLEWIAGETTKKEYTIDSLIEKAGCEVQTIIEADKDGK